MKVHLAGRRSRISLEEVSILLPRLLSQHSTPLSRSFPSFPSRVLLSPFSALSSLKCVDGPPACATAGDSKTLKRKKVEK